ncbi:MAG: ribosome recycling factor [Candidatus Shikimatogenerans bostrichidophilus]|nr:MAG: ribosome recycling factor [Candidatus Shikimatogenerans bostrichidophilus]
MKQNEIFKELDLDINNTIKYFQKYLYNIHYGKVNTSILKNIKVNINNKYFYLYNISNINVIDKITLKITPYDKKNINIIKKSLLYNNIGGSIFNKKNSIFFKLSLFSEDKRKELIKKIKIELEKVKVSLRLIRNKFNSNLKKDLIFSKDDKKNIQKKIKNIFDKSILKINDIFNIKKNEILKI